MISRKMAWLISGIISLYFLTALTGGVFAQAEGSSGAQTSGDLEVSTGENQGTDWKQEISSDKDALHEQRQNIRENARQARSEEKELLKQIEEAKASGDYETAKTLRDQLHTVHQENVAQKQDDMQELKGLRDEFKQDIQNVHSEGALPHLQGQEKPSDMRRPLHPEARDKLEDIHGRREDVRAHREDIKDRREDVRGRNENRQDMKEKIGDRGQHKGYEQGIRDHGAGVGTGKGQGGEHRSSGPGPQHSGGSAGGHHGGIGGRHR